MYPKRGRTGRSWLSFMPVKFSRNPFYKSGCIDNWYFQCYADVLRQADRHEFFLVFSWIFRAPDRFVLFQIKRHICGDFFSNDVHALACWAIGSYAPKSYIVLQQKLVHFLKPPPFFRHSFLFVCPLKFSYVTTLTYITVSAWPCTA